MRLPASQAHVGHSLTGAVDEHPLELEKVLVLIERTFIEDFEMPFRSMSVAAVLRNFVTFACKRQVSGVVLFGLARQRQRPGGGAWLWWLDHLRVCLLFHSWVQFNSVCRPDPKEEPSDTEARMIRFYCGQLL